MGLGSRFRARSCLGHGIGLEHAIRLGFRVGACDRRSARGAWEHEEDHEGSWGQREESAGAWEDKECANRTKKNERMGAGGEWDQHQHQREGSVGAARRNRRSARGANIG